MVQVFYTLAVGLIICRQRDDRREGAARWCCGSTPQVCATCASRFFLSCSLNGSGVEGTFATAASGGQREQKGVADTCVCANKVQRKCLVSTGDELCALSVTASPCQLPQRGSQGVWIGANDMRIWCSGSTTAFQAVWAGSSPVIRSRS